MCEDSVVIRAIAYHYEDIDTISWNIEIYLTGEEYELTHHNSPFGGKKIDKAMVYFYDATRNSPFDLRMDAHIHTSSSQFEILNSVRIFRDEYDLEVWLEDKEELDEGGLDYTDFYLDDLDGINSWTEYDKDNTLDVYGR
jgi:hypothetical protein